jgi:hypothetical protein
MIFLALANNTSQSGEQRPRTVWYLDSLMLVGASAHAKQGLGQLGSPAIFDGLGNLWPVVNDIDESGRRRQACGVKTTRPPSPPPTFFSPAHTHRDINALLGIVFSTKSFQLAQTGPKLQAICSVGAILVKPTCDK